jgi:hypothetical protein
MPRTKMLNPQAVESHSVAPLATLVSFMTRPRSTPEGREGQDTHQFAPHLHVESGATLRNPDLENGDNSSLDSAMGGGGIQVIRGHP